jgi:hypothetical protein
MISQTCYVVKDSFDGLTVLARFISESDAIKFASYSGYYGSLDKAKVEKETIVFFESITELEQNKMDKLKKQALSKLTSEERKALGFL